MTRFAWRGATADYDEWAALGNPGWAFEDVLPFFTRVEADTDFGGQVWQDGGGRLPITRYLDVELSEIAAAALDALEAVGFPSVEDHNRPGALGAGRMPMSSRDGRRVTTADAFLPVGKTPPNLIIRADAQVADIVFDGTRAVGIRLIDGAVIEAGWVVLCAGAYGSPAILMRSGIGPAEHLRSLGIPVRLDLPGVGAEPGRPRRRGHRLRLSRSGSCRADPAPHCHLSQLTGCKRRGAGHDALAVGSAR